MSIRASLRVEGVAPGKAVKIEQHVAGREGPIMSVARLGELVPLNLSHTQTVRLYEVDETDRICLDNPPQPLPANLLP